MSSFSVSISHLTAEEVFDLGTGIAINALMAQLTTRDVIVTSESLLKILSAGHVIAIAKNNGTIIGMGSLIFVPRLSCQTAEIHDVVVDNNFGNIGIGKMIMKDLIRTARETIPHLAFIELTSNPDRIPANRLYFNLGLKRRITNVWRMTLQ